MRGNGHTTPPAVDRHDPRPGLSSGGVVVRGPVRRYVPGPDSDVVRDNPGNVNDGGIVRARGPWLRYPRFVGPGNARPSWTYDGPIAPTLRMVNVSDRREAQGSRFHGGHTAHPAAVARTVRRYVVTPQQRPVSQSRVDNNRYRGQSYSATTVPVGGRR